MRRAVLSPVPLLLVMLSMSLLLPSCETSPPETPPPQMACASWQIVPSLNPGNVEDQLSDVFALGRKDIWVAGFATDPSTGPDPRALIEHWDGTSWTVVKNTTASDRSLTRIAGSSATDL